MSKLTNGSPRPVQLAKARASDGSSSSLGAERARPDLEVPAYADDVGPRFDVVDAGSIFAALEEPDYLVDKVARRGSLIEIASYGGSGKSWLGVEMLVAVASGTPWLGRFETKQGSALYLDYENGSYEMRRRFHAVARARGLTVPVPGVALTTMPSVYMTAPDDFERAVLEVATARDLVVVDTLKAATPGVDENDSNIRVGLDRLRRVGERTGCTFVTLIHGRKLGGRGAAGDPREHGRGSSAIYDAADAVFYARSSDDEPLRVSQTKSRMGRYIDPFLVTIGDTPDGGVLVSAVERRTQARSRRSSISSDCATWFSGS